MHVFQPCVVRRRIGDVCVIVLEPYPSPRLIVPCVEPPAEFFGTLKETAQHQVETFGVMKLVPFLVRAGGNDIGPLIQELMHRRVVPIGHDP